ncbi:MAG TPA: antibiotic biosynthesis monooxygenase [Burkholderiales bacterium]|nr:antibiotic biosynthesis monooxygenase [Burkholderiales bacterium]
MILEIADIRIKPGTQAAFEMAIAKGVGDVIQKAEGFMGHKVNRGIESPERYVLMVYWQTLENHTVDFRQSAAFAEWRALVGPYFAAPPLVEHFELLSNSG